jgi:hypothetical protein
LPLDWLLRLRVNECDDMLYTALSLAASDLIIFLINVVDAVSLLSLALTLMSPGSFNGHVYEYWLVNEVPWRDALAIAAQNQYNGVNGHLITISSQAEQNFIGCMSVCM